MNELFENFILNERDIINHFAIMSKIFDKNGEIFYKNILIDLLINIKSNKSKELFQITPYKNNQINDKYDNYLDICLSDAYALKEIYC